MTFTVSTKKYVGDLATIVMAGTDGQEIPVLHLMPGDVHFPGDAALMAANIASILNGNKPLHKVHIGENRIFWTPSSIGAEIRLQSAGEHS